MHQIFLTFILSYAMICKPTVCPLGPAVIVLSALSKGHCDNFVINLVTDLDQWLI